MAVDDRRLSNARKPGFGLGLLKGMGVTLKHLFKKNTVIQYPEEKQDLPARSRGVIALKEENCTVCMLCARECPDWCIYIDSHKEQLPPKREGGRPRKRNVLDRFAIDYALCMYCGICVEVCPYDALFWSREFEYSEYDIRQLTHEKERLSDWMATVLPPPPLEEGAEMPGQPAAASAQPAPPAPAPATTGPVLTAPAPAGPAAPAATATQAQPAAAPATSTAEAAPAAGPAAPPAQPAAASVATEAPTTEPGSEPTAPASPASPEPAPEASQAAAPPSASSPAPSAAATLAPETPAAPAAPATPTSAPATSAQPSEDPEGAYTRVLREQQAKGSSPQVAEARAKVARVKAQRAVPTGPTPIETDKMVPSAPTKGQPPEPVPSGAPEAHEPRPEQGPVAAETPDAAAGEAARVAPAVGAEAPGADSVEAPAAPAGQPQAAAPAEPSSMPPAEDPEAAYERVLAEERAKGSSDAVATARAKAARMRARKGTQGPQS